MSFLACYLTLKIDRNMKSTKWKLKIKLEVAKGKTCR